MPLAERYRCRNQITFNLDWSNPAHYRGRMALRPNNRSRGRAIRTLATGLAALLPAFAPSVADPPAASGQAIPSSYRYLEHGQEAGLVSGYLELASGSLDLGPKSAVFAGGRYALELSGPLSVEGLLLYVPTARDVVDPRRAEGDRTIGETDANLIMADARLAFSVTGRRTWRRVSPYIFAGAGAALDVAGLGEAENILLEEDRFDFGTVFTGSGGGGVRLAPSDRIMVRLDANIVLWRLQTPTGFGQPGKELEDAVQREWVRGFGFALGAAWRF